MKESRMDLYYFNMTIMEMNVLDFEVGNQEDRYEMGNHGMYPVMTQSKHYKYFLHFCHGKEWNKLSYCYY